jgi:hypothetical protein
LLRNFLPAALEKFDFWAKIGNLLSNNIQIFEKGLKIHYWNKKKMTNICPAF